MDYCIQLPAYDNDTVIAAEKMLGSDSIQAAHDTILKWKKKLAMMIAAVGLQLPIEYCI
jgi:hypothetical protein